ncbi:MAG: hypothetical protein ACQESR_29000, partial [Planctomycetota bacterium]
MIPQPVSVHAEGSQARTKKGTQAQRRLDEKVGACLGLAPGIMTFVATGKPSNITWMPPACPLGVHARCSQAGGIQGPFD